MIDNLKFKNVIAIAYFFCVYGNNINLNMFSSSKSKESELKI